VATSSSSAEASAAPAPPVTSPSASGHLPLVPILTTALAVALVGAGVGAYLAADDAHTTAVASCAGVVSSSANACDALKSPVHTWDWVAGAAWAAAAVSATVSVVLWTHKPGVAPSPSARLIIGPGSLTTQWSF
jgi:hypothetical protein